ncbi:HD-GYP domain-containing protein [Methylobacterium brachythecii]|uniref:Phosphohydrolase n=1 Tax=Methylobacterium brachythecii TaxID=1176177 RepID=A0A7W6F8Q2_9HYPH|nr:HD domain-containing phosphohydrolase [Methylobacterium brachythecii]MBB3904356.1 putative nucleotidyltransferase with HDIG domain [Methylobacterium brachythecii]GLS46518.1 phosphohydrolase [Methylobacterium brachythecii]
MRDPVALLLTDRPDRSAQIAAALEPAVDCRVLGMDEPWTEPAPLAGIIADVDIVRSQAKETVRKLRELAVPGDAPLVLLMRNRSARSFADAKSVGADVCLAARTAPHVVAETFLAKTHPRRELIDLTITRAIGRAGRALTTLLDAARADQSLDVDAFETGVDPILTAVADGGLVRWLDIVWSFDDATYQHCMLVAGLAAALALHVGFSASDRLHLVRSALIHDIGKAKIPLKILNKPGRLDDDEMRIMRTHAALGHALLIKATGFDAQTLDVVLHHHEMLDGSGYPDGLKGDAISDRVRLITICDIYAALIERRPYRAPMGHGEALRVLHSMGGKLDRDLLAAFEQAIVKR